MITDPVSFKSEDVFSHLRVITIPQLIIIFLDHVTLVAYIEKLIKLQDHSKETQPRYLNDNRVLKN